MQNPGEARDILFDFEVEDSGPGVPEHLRQEIFKPFVQGDLALSKKYGGTGLGLAICSQLAQLMGGSIHLKSTVGIGSTFTLSVPLKYTRERAPSVSNSLARPGSKMTASKPPSVMSRSLKDEPRSTKPWTRESSPARVSVYSGHESQLDVPRIVGYSQPYITDAASTYEEKRPDNTVQRPPPGSPPLLSRQTTAKDEMKARHVEPPLLKMTPKDPSVQAAVIEKQRPQIKVLIAEDNKVNQEVILRMLKLEKVTGKRVDRPFCRISRPLG